jgi:hypothetical protein
VVGLRFLPQGASKGLSLDGRREELGAITLNNLKLVIFIDMMVKAFSNTHVISFAMNTSLHFT